MKRAKKQAKKLIIAAALLGICVLCVSTAWATLSFVKSVEEAPAFVDAEGFKIPSVVLHESRSRAPEQGKEILGARYGKYSLR